MTHHHVELCGPKKSNLSSGAKSAAGPFVPEVITSQIIFGKYTFPNVTELGRRESFVGERDNGKRIFLLLMSHSETLIENDWLDSWSVWCNVLLKIFPRGHVLELYLVAKHNTSIKRVLG